MKQVIKKQTYYNLLLMRDDSDARTLRLHRTALWVLFTLLAALVIGGALGIAGGIHYWKKCRDLRATYSEQDREFSEMRLQLERLSNLESLMEASNGVIPQAKNEEVGASPLPDARQNATRALPDSGRTPGVNAISPGAAGNATLSPDSASGVVPQGQSNATLENPAGEASASSANGTGAVKGVLPLNVGDCPVRVDNFYARVSGSQRLRISYNLSSSGSESQRNIVGGVRYQAVFANGSRLDLPLTDMDGTRFSILRMKPMQSVARLPEGRNADDIKSINMYIEVTGGKSYVGNFPFTQ
ncbi:MAG: hypothetical protein LBH65_03400 [Desulfovibrio sp.]|jgi:hypothetical protein|nr:hypothetical protein [Desulfovibrio sp.]